MSDDYDAVLSSEQLRAVAGRYRGHAADYAKEGRWLDVCRMAGLAVFSDKWAAMKERWEGRADHADKS